MRAEGTLHHQGLFSLTSALLLAEFHLFSPQKEAALIVGFSFIVEGISLDREEWKKKEGKEPETDEQEKRQADRY